MSTVADSPRLTSEEAVRWYRAQPGKEQEVLDTYLDLPVLPAARRYAASEEFAEVARLLGPANGRAVLDVGAGNGIASYALAEAGWKVTAFEPDPSGEIGAGAIHELVRETGVRIAIEERLSTPLPFPDGAFAVIFARQVLHHLPDLHAAMRDFFRLLQPGGVMLALREHVAENEAERAAFLQAHPLQRFTGTENAFPLETGYLGAARGAGFEVRECWGPLESILNFAPGTERERRKLARWLAGQRYLGFGRLFAGSEAFIRESLRRHTAKDRTPGRIYSFLLQKP